MIHVVRRIVAILSLASSAFIAHAQAQCPDWQPGFHLRGSDGEVRALCVFDDGSGPAVYVGGTFNAIGPVVSGGIARFDGAQWSDVGGGLPTNPLGDPYSGVYSLCVFDDGSGPALYAAGRFTTIGGVAAANIARWDGSAWAPLGAGISGLSFNIGYAMTVFQVPGDAAPSLFVAGQFATAGGLPAASFAKWDGTAWTVPAMVYASDHTSPASVFALAVHDDGLGGGPGLFLGGTFWFIDNASIGTVAKWDGVAWSGLSPVPDGQVNSLASFDPDGTGPGAARLFAGGPFSHAGGVNARAIAQWNGSAWSAVGGSANTSLSFIGFDGLHVLNDGTGPALFAKGSFTMIGGVSARGIAKWNGSAWSALGSGIGVIFAGETGGPMVEFASALIVGGNFRDAGGVKTFDLARWNGSAWSVVALGNGVDAAVRCAEFSTVGSSSGADLYVGGEFTNVGGIPAQHIAKWNGSAWSALGSGLVPFSDVPEDRVALDMKEFDDGSGRALYVAGSLISAGGVPASYVARWNGSTWSAVGSGLPFPTYVLEIFDDGTGGGPALFAAGNLHKLWRWNGTAWSDREGVAGGDVYALVAHDDGSGNGTQLFLGGTFTQVGPVPTNRVAKWRGSACGPCGAALGNGVNGRLNAFARFDENGAGAPLLFAGGEFTSAGTVIARHVARWDGSAWSALGSGPSVPVKTLIVFDDGSGGGPALYAGGGQVNAGGSAAFERWTGSSWVSAEGSIGTHFETSSTTSVECSATGSLAGARPSLVIGGKFTWTDEVASARIAQLVACPTEPGTAFCFGDGSLSTPCPCAPPDVVPNPSGGPDGGCANSFDLAGGKLVAHGVTNPDSVVLRGTRLSPAGYSMFMAAHGVDTNGIALADGVRCARGAFIRFGGQFAAAGTVSYPNPDVGHTLALHSITSTVLGGGETIYYQIFYRNAAAGFCSPSTFNLTSAYRVTWN